MASLEILIPIDYTYNGQKANATNLNEPLKDLLENINILNDKKAPKDSPVFTGNVTLPSSTTIGSVSPEEISFLDGLTSSVQTQLNSKSNSHNPVFTGTVTLPSSTVLGNVNSSALNALEGVTSNIQAQLDSLLSQIQSLQTGKADLSTLNNLFSYTNGVLKIRASDGTWKQVYPAVYGA